MKRFDPLFSVEAGQVTARPNTVVRSELVAANEPPPRTASGRVMQLVELGTPERPILSWVCPEERLSIPVRV